ncbi:MAG: Tic22 family protein, partial [Waterburya sp.]
VFTIADEQGSPLVASGDDENKVAGVFISEQDANDFVTELQTKNPELASKVKVVPVSLGEIYKLSESSQSQENALNFTYVPEEEQIETAKTILSEDGEEYQGGVPLFVAKGGDDQGYLTIEKDGQQVIPFFFDKQQLDEMIAKFQQQEPELADSINIEVVPLEGVIETLETSNDDALSKIVLVPSSESIEFLNSSSLGSTEDQSNVYRFFNEDTGTHFYTASESEKDNIVENLSNYTFEGSSYLGADPLTGSPEPEAVHRFFNKDTGTHLYTISEAESNSIRDNLTNYTDEGTAFHAYSSQQEGTIPIYRFFNTETGTHFYTPSVAEKDNVENNLLNYKSEGIAYYAFPVESDVI